MPKIEEKGGDEDESASHGNLYSYNYRCIKLGIGRSFKS